VCVYDVIPTFGLQRSHAAVRSAPPRGTSNHGGSEGVADWRKCPPRSSEKAPQSGSSSGSSSLWPSAPCTSTTESHPGLATLQVFTLGPRSGAVVERNHAMMVDHGNLKARLPLLARARRGAANMAGHSSPIEILPQQMCIVRFVKRPPGVVAYTISCWVHSGQCHFRGTMVAVDTARDSEEKVHGGVTMGRTDVHTCTIDAESRLAVQYENRVVDQGCLRAYQHESIFRYQNSILLLMTPKMLM
jgi:hypothetical protein